MLTPQSFVKSDFPETAEVRRQRSLRSGKRAKITNRLRRQETEQPAAPVAPTPMPRRALDPLGSPAQQMIEPELARKRQTEREWRERLQSVDLKPGRDEHMKASALRPWPPRYWPAYIPCRWAIMVRLQNRGKSK